MGLLDAITENGVVRVPYNYSQMTYVEKPLPESLKRLQQALAGQLGTTFNNCLLNFYQDGSNSMGFHSDSTEELIEGTGVAIVSLGSVREITYRSKTNREHKIGYPLKPGSLLYMDDAVQENWLHAIEKAPDVGPRISLTWRAFKDK